MYRTIRRNARGADDERALCLTQNFYRQGLVHELFNPSDVRVEKTCPSSIVLTAAYVKFCIHQRRLHAGALYAVEIDSRQVL